MLDKKFLQSSVRYHQVETELRYRTMHVPVAEIDSDLCKAMVELYHTYYDGSNEEKFRADLLEKHEAVLLFFDDALVGFTTWMHYEHQWNNQTLRIIFSGDTIVHRDHWGQQNLAFAKLRRMADFRNSAPGKPLYWFLLVKGHRTYRYLSAFAINWFPHWGRGSADLQCLADSLARTRYGSMYNPVTGVVEFPATCGYLKNVIAYPSPKELEKKEVQFFIERNPLFHQGHELVCVCELSENNLKPIAARIFKEI